MPRIATLDRRLRYGRRAGGFTLIEVLVAFTILALSLGVLYQSAGGSVTAVRSAVQTDRAVLWARSILGRWPEVGSNGWNDSGTTDDGFRWSIQSRALSDPEQLRRRWGLYEVEVVVAWGEQRHPRSVRLYSIRGQFHGDSSSKPS